MFNIGDEMIERRAVKRNWLGKLITWIRRRPEDCALIASIVAFAAGISYMLIYVY